MGNVVSEQPDQAKAEADENRCTCPTGDQGREVIRAHVSVEADEESQGPMVTKMSTLNFRTFLRERNGSIFDAYERLGDLGEGAFGDVWLARERIRAHTGAEHSGRKVAVKRIRKPNSSVGLDPEEHDSEEAITDLRIEVDLMKSLDHPSICRLLQVYEDPKNLFLVMEHIKGGELCDRVMEMESGFGEREAAQVIRQSAAALSYCHSHGVVHRDIKPENILVADAEEGDEVNEDEEVTIKLIDFGLSCKILQGAKLKAKVGTFLYSAPEILRGDLCDEKVDTWALGCVLYALLSGNSPFSRKGEIIAGQYTLAEEPWSHVSEPAKDLIRGLLKVNPRERLGAHDMHNHPWLHHEHHINSCRKTLSHALTNMQSFHKQSGLSHLCTGVLARQMDETALHDLHQTFTQLDDDEDGTISISEFRRAWKEMGVACPEDVEQLFQDLDMDGNGRMDYTEFVAACMDRKMRTQEELCWAAFRVFDLDNDGSISFQEMHQVLMSASIQEAFDDSVLEQLWRQLTGQELGKDPPGHDGVVDFDHFLAALSNADGAISEGEGRQEQEGNIEPVPAPPQQGKAAGGLGELPIARRHRGAGRDKVVAAGTAGLGALPIAGRRRPEQDPPAPAGGLPIAGRRKAEPEAAPGGGQSQGGGLPIAGRGGGLPISGRHRSAPQASQGYPNGAGGDSNSSGGGVALPVASRGSPSGGGGSGLPIASRH